VARAPGALLKGPTRRPLQQLRARAVVPIHPNAWNRNSRKFAVASDPPIPATSTREQHGSASSAPKRPDQVAFVAPSSIKVLRLVTT
jgi:hypothetical protein